MKTAIIYHRVDWDGYTAAAVAKMAYPEAELIGWTYGDNEPDVSDYDHVIVVDLSLSEAWMFENAPKLTWIDHHKNAIDSLQTNPILEVVPGIRKDGLGACYLAWIYFVPELSYRKRDIPQHIKLIATADVWDYDKTLAPLKDSLTYMLAMDEYGPGWNYTTKQDVSKDLVKKAGLLIEFDEDSTEEFYHGCELEKIRFNHEVELFKDASMVVVDDHIGYMLKIDGRPGACLQSHLLNEWGDFFICIGDFQEDKRKYKISVRSSKHSGFDASAFCRQYGGNGHVPAAGCLMSKEEIDSLL